MTREERRTRRRAMELAAAGGSGLEGHARRVARLALATADGLDDGLRQDVELTALLHDIGKLALPYRLLQKADGLDDGDWTLVRTHSVWGERLCLSHAFPARIARLVRATHERW